MPFNCSQIIEKQLAQHLWDISPIELKVYIALVLLARHTDGELSISAYRLSQKANLYAKDGIAALKKLEQRKLIQLKFTFIPTEEIKIIIIDSKERNEENNDLIYQYNGRDDLEHVVYKDNSQLVNHSHSIQKARYNVNNDNVINNDIKNNILNNVIKKKLTRNLWITNMKGCKKTLNPNPKKLTWQRVFADH